MTITLTRSHCFAPQCTARTLRPKALLTLRLQALKSAAFVHWCKVDHRHCDVRYVSPAQRPEGKDQTILAARNVLYTNARELNQASWSGNTRNWPAAGAVTLNPERVCIVNQLSVGKKFSKWLLRLRPKDSHVQLICTGDVTVRKFICTTTNQNNAKAAGLGIVE